MLIIRRIQYNTKVNGIKKNVMRYHATERESQTSVNEKQKNVRFCEQLKSDNKNYCVKSMKNKPPATVSTF